MATTTLFNEKQNYLNGILSSNNANALNQAKLRPAEIKEDVKLMEQRSRVSIIMNSQRFKCELEQLVEQQALTTSGKHKRGGGGAGKAQTSLDDGEAASTLSLNYISQQLLNAAMPIRGDAPLGTGLNCRRLCGGGAAIIPVNDLRGNQPASAPGSDTKPMYSASEAKLRCQMACVCRLMHQFQWTNSAIGTSVLSVRVSREQDQLLAVPFGLLAHEVTASTLLRLNGRGEVQDRGSTVLDLHPADPLWPLFSGLHMARREFVCLLLLASPAALALSASATGSNEESATLLLPLCREALELGQLQQLKGGLGADQEELRRVAGGPTDGGRVIVLPGQGLLVCATSVEDAWHLAHCADIAADMQARLAALPADELCLLPVGQYKPATSALRKLAAGEGTAGEALRASEAELQWEALMRHLDNGGYRTGHVYRRLPARRRPGGDDVDSALIDVQIPAATSSLVAPPGVQRMHSVDGAGGTGARRVPWFNTPNSYVRDDSYIGSPAATNAASGHKWVSAGSPGAQRKSHVASHPVTPGAHLMIRPAHAPDQMDGGRAATLPAGASLSGTAGVGPDEYRAQQRVVRGKYYADETTCGPQSRLLDDLTWEEARRVRDESLAHRLGAGALPEESEKLLGAASKGIIRRDCLPTTVVYDRVYTSANPFEGVTEGDMDKYRDEVHRKNNPHLYPQKEPEPPAPKQEPQQPPRVNGDVATAAEPRHLPQLREEGPATATTTAQISVPTQAAALSDVSGEPSDLAHLQYGSHSLRKAAGHSTLPPPGRSGAVTSETSAAEVSHDEGTMSSTGKKKKKRLGLFSKFRKDK